MEELHVDLDNTLGSGKFGTVYRIEYNGAFVALKAFGITSSMYGAKFSDKARLDFMTECKVVQQCSHDNIVQYLATAKVRINGVIFPALLMTLMEVSLRNYLWYPDAQNLAPHKEIKIANDIAQALNYLHEVVNLVHGDLHCGNVLLKCTSAHEGPLVKICDFGLAMIINSVSQQHSELQSLSFGSSLTTTMSVNTSSSANEDNGSDSGAFVESNTTGGGILVDCKKPVTPQGTFEKSSTASGGKKEMKKPVTQMNPQDLEMHRFGTIMWSIHTRLSSLSPGTTRDKNLTLIANRPLHDVVKDCWSTTKPSAKDLLKRFKTLKEQYPPVIPAEIMASQQKIILSQQETIVSQQNTIELLNKKIAEYDGKK